MVITDDSINVASSVGFQQGNITDFMICFPTSRTDLGFFKIGGWMSKLVKKRSRVADTFSKIAEFAWFSF